MMATSLKRPCRSQCAFFTLGLIFLVMLNACSPSAPNPRPTPAVPQTSPSPRADITPSATPTLEPTATPTVQIVFDAARLQGATIHFWHPWSGAVAETLQALINEFNQTNDYQLSVEVTAQPGGWDDLENRLTGALETGQPPDLAAGFVHQANRWESQGRTVDLQPYLLDPEWGLGAAALADFYPAVWDLGMIRGDTRAAVPLLPSGTVLIYNGSWAQELGYRTPPVSVQQFADQTCAAADGYRKDNSSENDGTGGMIATPGYAAALNWISAFDGNVITPQEEDGLPYAFNQAETDDAFAYLRDLYDEGCIWANDQVYTEEVFARRAALFASVDLIDLRYITQAMQRAGRDDRWAVIPYPSDETSTGISLSGPTLIVFKSTPERQLAAWLLTRWLLQPSNHARLVQASGAFPLRQSELPLLEEYRITNPQWSMALDLLKNAQPEPALASWGEVRWALADAFTQLFRGYFEAKNIPTMLEYLDSMAAELHTGELPEDLFTPVPSATP